MTDRLRRRHNVKVTGDGPVTFLFVHGLGCDQSMWRLVAPAFGSQARVVTMDLMGCGDSEPADWTAARYATLDGHAADVVAVTRAFATRRTVLVGHSVGAMIGLLADLQAPGLFEAHAMVAPSPCYLNGPGYAGGFDRSALEGLVDLVESSCLDWAQVLAPQLAGPARPPALANDLVAAFCRAHPPALRQFARATFLSDLRPQLSLLHKPVLLLRCSDDLIAPAAVGRYMQAQLPDCTMQELSNHGHCPQLSNPDDCVAAISTFVGSLGLGYDHVGDTAPGALHPTRWDSTATPS